MSSAVPHALIEEVSILWKLCQPVLTASATAEDAVRTADEVYRRLEELVATGAKTPAEPSTDAPDIGMRPGASEEGADAYRPVENLFYRGEMNADLVAGQTEQQEHARIAGQAAGSAEQTGAGTGAQREQPSQDGDALGGGRSLPSVVEELLALEVEASLLEADGGDERVYRYPEWDYRLQDHRMNWCRVFERAATRGSDECVSGTLTAYRSTVRLLRRFFEGLRPPAFRRLAGQPDGEELDVDAVVRRAAEQRAGFEGSDRIYVRHGHDQSRDIDDED